MCGCAPSQVNRPVLVNVKLISLAVVNVEWRFDPVLIELKQVAPMVYTEVVTVIKNNVCLCA